MLNSISQIKNRLFKKSQTKTLILRLILKKKLTTMFKFDFNIYF